MNDGDGHAPSFVQIVEELLRAGHSVRFRAEGWSMHPTIRNGESIIVAPLGPSPVRSGDVVLYRQGRAAIAHRVIHVRSVPDQPAGLVLRGDGADVEDRPIGSDQVLGRVLAVERGLRTMRLGLVSRSWSRLLGRTLRMAHGVRAKVAALRSHRDLQA